jgi:hypothetical protein
VLAPTMFEGFTGDDGVDLVAGGFLRATQLSGGRTAVQVDVDGGGNSFETLAIIDGCVSTSVLAEHVTVKSDWLI